MYILVSIFYRTNTFSEKENVSPQLITLQSTNNVQDIPIILEGKYLTTFNSDNYNNIFCYLKICTI